MKGKLYSKFKYFAQNDIFVIFNFNSEFNFTHMKQIQMTDSKY